MSNVVEVDWQTLVDLRRGHSEAVRMLIEEELCARDAEIVMLSFTLSGGMRAKRVPGRSRTRQIACEGVIERGQSPWAVVNASACLGCGCVEPRVSSPSVVPVRCLRVVNTVESRASPWAVGAAVRVELELEVLQLDPKWFYLSGSHVVLEHVREVVGMREAALQPQTATSWS